QGDAFGNRFQHQGPIDGGIAATGNQHFFSGKLLHVVDKIIKSFSFKAFRLGQVQFARFKGAASRRDDDRPGKVDLFGGGELEDAVGALFHLQHFFVETINGIGRFGLFNGVVYQFLGAHLGESRHIVNVFFRVEGGKLAAKLGHALDHFDGHLAHSRVNGGEQTRRSTADDGDVDNGIFAHLLTPPGRFNTLSGNTLPHYNTAGEKSGERPSPFRKRS